jgi:pimeloyl-ACP methyl ester carboxylesterase
VLPPRARQTTVVFKGGAGTVVADHWNPDGGRGALVMLHGGGQTRHSWDRAAALLGALDWQVFTVDSRGHGDSQWAAGGDYSPDAFVGDLSGVVEQIGDLTRDGVPPVLIGASLGGVTSLLAEGESPGLARALVLVDVVPRIEAAGARRIGDFMSSAPSGFSSLQEVADAVAAYQPHRNRSTTPTSLKRNVRRGPNGRWYWHWDPAFLSLGDAVDGGRLHARLAEAARNVCIPTLLVRGAMSDVVSREGVEEFRQLIPASQVVDVAGATHMVAGDDNGVFVNHMIGFLDTLPPAAGRR